jgi:translocator protein
MKVNNFFKFVISVGISLLAGVIGSFFTMPSIQSGWYGQLVKPALNPPNWIFGPVWTALYFLIGISLFLVWKNNWKVLNPIFKTEKKAWNKWSERLWKGDLQKANAILIFSVQYILNLAWSFVFFGIVSPFIAFCVILALWFAIICTIVNFYRISKLSAYLLIPYILWVSFAGYLNLSIWLLN